MKNCRQCGKEFEKNGVTLGIKGVDFDYCSIDCFSKAAKNKDHAKEIGALIFKNRNEDERLNNS